MIRRLVAGWLVIGMAASAIAACKSSGKSEADGVGNAKDASADSGAEGDSSTGGAKQTASKKDAGVESDDDDERGSGGSGQGDGMTGDTSSAGRPDASVARAGASTGDAGEPPGSAGLAGSGADSAGGPSAEVVIANCDDLGAHACERLEQCAAFYIQAYYGDISTCQQFFSQLCAGSSPESRPSFARCGKQIASCSEIRRAKGVPPACYLAAGQSSIGETCLLDTDCAEGLCERAKGDEAGECAVPAELGEECVAPTRCQVGLFCSPLDETCVQPRPDGQACASPFECEFGAQCTEQRTCVTKQPGDSCAPPLVNCPPGQACLLDECVEIQWAGDQEPCASSNKECVGLTRCASEWITDLQQITECRPVQALGEACAAGQPCVEPLVCRSGTCAI